MREAVSVFPLGEGGESGWRQGVVLVSDGHGISAIRKACIIYLQQLSKIDLPQQNTPALFFSLTHTHAHIICTRARTHTHAHAHTHIHARTHKGARGRF